MTKHYSEIRTRSFNLLLVIVLAGLTANPADAQEKAEAKREVETVDRASKRLFDDAMELIEVKQFERGLAMLDTVIRDNSGNILGYRAHMAKGKHFLEQGKAKEAQSHFMLLSRLLKPEAGETPSEEMDVLYKDALFNSGLAYYQSGQYASSFPVFRQLTEIAGKSKWANQAYYYIGMSHYNLKNWNKAIDALSLVGTEVEDTGEKIGRIEIGQRFYAKISDDDIQVLTKLGTDVYASVKVSSGDEEKLIGKPVPGKKNELMVSAPTRIGKASLKEKNDGILQMVGGDTLTIVYTDDSTLEGKKNVEREGKVMAVSTGTIGFYLGDLETPANVAWPGQPQAVLLRDADLDTDGNAQTYKVTVRSRYKIIEEKSDDDEDSMLDIFAGNERDKETWKERDSIEITLKESGEGPVIRTGMFTGNIQLGILEKGTEPDTNDTILHCEELDELIVEYEDQVHLYGSEPRTSTATIKVAGSVKSGVDVNQYRVTEKVTKAKKGIVESEALKGLGEIFKDMGLQERAGAKATEALKRVDSIIIDRKFVPSELVENAFRLKWENEFIKDDFKAATATCLAFNRLYPESVLADQAMMTLARTLAERRQFNEAMVIYGKVMKLQNPISAAEAQYRIGEVQEDIVLEENKDATDSQWTKSGIGVSEKAEAMGAAIRSFTLTFQKYPESPFAAQALNKVVQYHVTNRNYAQATDLLEKTFSDYPDAEFLDEMLFLWAKVGYQMNNPELTKEKLNKLLFEYPASKRAAEAKKMLASPDLK